MPVKRARVGTARKGVPLDVCWTSSDYKRAWTSCLDVLRHTQQSRFVSLFTCHRYIDKFIFIAPVSRKESLGASVAKEMCFQRSSERIEGKSRPPQSGWKIVPQSRTGCRETPIAKFVVCSWHKQRDIHDWITSNTSNVTMFHPVHYQQ